MDHDIDDFEGVERPAPAARTGGVNRRGFLQIAGYGAATATAVLGTARVAMAGNGWTVGLDGVPDDKVNWMYRTMLKSRWWEEEMKEAFLAGNDGLYGAFHISIGEEACSTGIMAALNEDDYIASNHRGHSHLIAKGGDLAKMSAELFFKESGYNRGFGGSMHITDVSKGILGMNGIIGPQYLFAAGAAYSAKVRGSGQVAVAFGGDGSVNNGWYYSGLRNAALYKLPMIAVVENNGYQMSMPQDRTNNLINLHEFGAGLDVAHEAVNGMDVMAVYAVAKRAVERARNESLPTLIECKTYRYYDHAGLAGARAGELGAFGLPYRADSEVRAWIAEDPIPKLRRQMVANSIITEEQADQIEAEVRAEVLASIEFARNSAAPTPESGLEHVFSGMTVAPSQFIA